MNTKYDIYAVIIIPMLILYIALRVTKRVYKHRDISRREISKQRLKEIGEKITVSYDKLKFISLESRRSIGFTGRSKSINAYNDNKRYEAFEIHFIECVHNRKKFKSESIVIDKEVLKIKLYLQKEVHIYHDARTNEYFFDLDFLEYKQEKLK